MPETVWVTAGVLGAASGIVILVQILSALARRHRRIQSQRQRDRSSTSVLSCALCSDPVYRTRSDAPYVMLVHEQDGWRLMVHPDEDSRADLRWKPAHAACWDETLSLEVT